MNVQRAYEWIIANLEQYDFSGEEAQRLRDDLVKQRAEGKSDLSDKLFRQFLILSLRKDGQEHSCAFDMHQALLSEINFVSRRTAIRPKCLDACLIHCSMGFVPVGLYRKERPFESVVLQLDSLKQLEDGKWIEEEQKTASLFLKQTRDAISEDLDTVPKEKKPSGGYAAGLLISGILMEILGLLFFIRTHLFSICKGIGSADLFASMAEQGIRNYAIFGHSGRNTWLLMAIVHIILMIVGQRLIRWGREETKLVRMKKAARKLLIRFDDMLSLFGEGYKNRYIREKDRFLLEIPQDRNLEFLRDESWNKIEKINMLADLSKKYVSLPKTHKSTVKGKQRIWIPVVLATMLIMSAAASNNTVKWVQTAFSQHEYTTAVAADQNGFRTKKMVETKQDPVYIYGWMKDLGAPKNSLEIFRSAEVIGESGYWLKIRRIESDRVLQGWVKKTDVGTYNDVDMDLAAIVPINTVKASSYYQGKTVYYPAYLVDGRLDSVWQDGTDGEPVGESIQFNFTEPVWLDMMQIVPGDGRGEARYTQNARLKRIRVTLSDGSSSEFHFDDGAFGQYQTLFFNKTINTSSITIEVLDVYPGSMYPEVSVAEVRVLKRRE